MVKMKSTPIIPMYFIDDRYYITCAHTLKNGILCHEAPRNRRSKYCLKHSKMRHKSGSKQMIKSEEFKSDAIAYIKIS